MWAPHLLSSNVPLLWILYIGFAVFGFGNGLTFVTVIRNSWMYFPKNKGLITGIILVGIGGSSLIFTWQADSIINPKYVLLDLSSGFFPKEVNDRFYNYLFALTILIGVLSLISFLMIFDQLKVVKEDRTTEFFITNTENRLTPVTQAMTQVEVEIKAKKIGRTHV